MNQKILVGTDGSQAARGALAWTLARCGKNDEIEILYVVDDAYIQHSEVYQQEALKGATELVAKEVAYAQETNPDVSVTSNVVLGDPVAEIRGRSAAKDLVVIGSDKIGIMQGYLLGSRSIQIASSCDCAVAVIPQISIEGRSGVVVGVDGSEASKEAIAFAAAQADATGQPLIAVHAWVLPTVVAGDFVGVVEEHEAFKVEHEKTLSTSLAGLAEQYPDLEIQRKIVQDAPLRALHE